MSPPRELCSVSFFLSLSSSLARAVVRSLKSSHLITAFKSLHWIKSNEHTEYKLYPFPNI